MCSVRIQYFHYFEFVLVRSLVWVYQYVLEKNQFFFEFEKVKHINMNVSSWQQFIIVSQ